MNRMSDAVQGIRSEGWRGGRWRALGWGVRSQGRAKAEGWSPSVSLVHSKVAITQDWLATGPLAPWLFLYFHFFPFFPGSLFPPDHQSFSLSLKTLSLHFKCLSLSFSFAFLSLLGLCHITRLYSYSQGPNFSLFLVLPYFLSFFLSQLLQGNASHWWTVHLSCLIPPFRPTSAITSLYPLCPRPSSAFIPIAAVDRAVKIWSVRLHTQAVSTILLSWQQDAVGREDHYSAHPFRSVSSRSWRDMCS